MAAEADAAKATSSEVLLVARLALGMGGAPPGPIDWERTLRCAAEERCAALAWLRSGALIRRLAPAGVVGRWRSCALVAEDTAAERLRQLRALIAILGEANVAPVVMKGVPLAIMLYGNASARPVSDTDLFVPASQREAAHAALIGAGWVRLYGGREQEETYRRVDDGRPHFLELHSSLLDENMLQHLRGPAPEVRRLDAGGTSFMAHAGASLTVFLAVHLAKHPRVPLLWWLDFATLWAGLNRSQRLEASALARKYRLHRFLDWAVAGAGDVAAIAVAADEAARARALSRLRARHSRHPVLRITALAPSLGDRAGVFLAWAFPRADRAHPMTLARRTMERGLDWTQRRLRGGLGLSHGA